MPRGWNDPDARQNVPLTQRNGTTLKASQEVVETRKELIIAEVILEALDYGGRQHSSGSRLVLRECPKAISDVCMKANILTIIANLSPLRFVLVTALAGSHWIEGRGGALSLACRALWKVVILHADCGASLLDADTGPFSISTRFWVY